MSYRNKNHCNYKQKQKEVITVKLIYDQKKKSKISNNNDVKNELECDRLNQEAQSMHYEIENMRADNVHKDLKISELE